MQNWGADVLRCQFQRSWNTRGLLVQGSAVPAIKVGANGTIIDGNHRYVASLLSGTNLEVVKLSYSMGNPVPWEAVKLIDELF